MADQFEQYAVAAPANAGPAPGPATAAPAGAADPFARFAVAPEDLNPPPNALPDLSQHQPIAPDDHTYRQGDTQVAPNQPAPINQAPGTEAHTAGVAARGAIGGAASILTAPFDAGAAAVNFVKKHVLGYKDEDLLQTNAGDLVKAGLDKLGFPTAASGGEKAVEIGSSVLGGGIAGGLTSAALRGGTAATGAADAGTGGVKSFWQTGATKAGTPNQAIVNNAWGQQIGEPGVTKLTSDVLARADTRIGAALDAGRGADRAVFMDPADISGQIHKLASNTTPELLDHPLVAQFMDASNNTAAMSAAKLGDLSSQLGKAGKSVIHDNYNLGDGLFKTKNMVEDMISDGLSPPEKAAYDSARGQYRALWGQLLARTSNINAASGDVNGANLGRFLQQTDSAGYTLGKNTSAGYTAARAAQQQSGDTSLVEAIQNHVPFLKAVMQFAGGKAQSLLQQGIPAAGRALVNKPGFMAGLVAQFKQAHDDEVQKVGSGQLSSVEKAPPFQMPAMNLTGTPGSVNPHDVGSPQLPPTGSNPTADNTPALEPGSNGRR